ncbi:Riboflavin biosynthesis protein pyrd protein, partial [Thalictrum thalictroides]
ISRSANVEGYVVRRVTIRKCRVFALRDAGDLAANATTYVNLEPCNHYRRTPPCTEALISAKVKRVDVRRTLQKAKRGIYPPNAYRETFHTLRYSLSVNGQLSDQLGEAAKEAGGYYSLLKHIHNWESIPTSQESHVKQPLQIIIATYPNSPVQLPHFNTDAASQVMVFAEKDIGTDPEIVQQGIEQ